MANMLEQLADSSPQLRAAYEFEFGEWKPKTPPCTILAGVLARALVAAACDTPDAALTNIFGVCEAAFQEGAEDGDAIATGFLEGLQHADGRNDFDFRRVVSYLGPRSRAHCEAMDRFNGTVTRGL